MSASQYVNTGVSRGRLILVGGFAGAGKTSLLRIFGGWLAERGLKIGIITNDQGVGLIDTQRLGHPASSGPQKRTPVEVQEVTGGCFCCKADAFVEQLKTMTAQFHPDIFLAEPAGSCTDLVATVMGPLRHVYKLGFERGPYAVVLDARKLYAFTGVSTGVAAGKRTPGNQPEMNPAAISHRKSGFSDAVDYIYQKQMEEAEILVLNKTDLLSRTKNKRLLEALQREYPGKRVMSISTLTGEGVADLLELLLADEHVSQNSIEVDYDLYAKGEALLGWYNAEFSVHAATGEGFDADGVLLETVRAIQRRLEQDGAMIAHFKASLQDKASRVPPARGIQPGMNQEMRAGEGLAVVQVVSNGERPRVSSKSQCKLMVGRMLINLRAEAEAKRLRMAVETTLSQSIRNAHFVMLESEASKPGRPVPRHRLAKS